MKRKVSIFISMVSAFICCGGIAGMPEIAVTGKQVIDFGGFPANLKQKGVFEIVNQGNAELVIKQVRKTCGCSEVELSDKKIAPGGKATLIAYIKENSIAGPFAKAIYVENNDPRQRFLRLTLSGKAIPLVKIHPKPYLYIGTLKPGIKYEYKFRLEATQDNVKLELLKPRANFPVTADLLSDEPKSFILTVHTEPDKPEAQLTAELEIKIISPVGWKPIKVKLQGQSKKE